MGRNLRKVAGVMFKVSPGRKFVVLESSVKPSLDC